MRVTVHTPAVLVEEYELPDRYRDYVDDVLLARVRNRAPASSVYTYTGDPVVFSRGGDPFDEAADRFVAARQALTEAEEHARREAVATADAGRLSEYAIADRLGIDRLTVRRWRGKTDRQRKDQQ